MRFRWTTTPYHTMHVLLLDSAAAVGSLAGLSTAIRLHLRLNGAKSDWIQSEIVQKQQLLLQWQLFHIFLLFSKSAKLPDIGLRIGWLATQT